MPVVLGSHGRSTDDFMRFSGKFPCAPPFGRHQIEGVGATVALCGAFAWEFFSSISATFCLFAEWWLRKGVV